MGTVHSRSQSLSGLQPGQQQPQDSPKKSADKGPAPNPPLTGEAQLKYENDRLKLALAQSSANAKKWEVELTTLKNNNEANVGVTRVYIQCRRMEAATEFVQ